jgi:hypothetical protein
VLSAGNREWLRVIAEKTPGLVRLERGERGRITPKVMHERV